MNIPDLTVRWATSRDFTALMDFLHLAFSTRDPDHPRFETFFPELARPDEHIMNQSLLALHHDQIVGCVAVYNIPLILDDQPTDIGGIGNVSTHPDFRSRGIMQILLDQALLAMRDERKYALAWLSGDRRRYQRWAFETVPWKIVYELGPRGPCLHEYAQNTGWHISSTTVTNADWHLLWQHLSQIPYLSVCGPETLALKYQRRTGDSHVYIARHDDQTALLITNLDSQQVTGWAGSPTGLGVLLHHLLSPLDNDTRPTVSLPVHESVYQPVFNGAAEHYRLKDYGSLAILDLARTLQTFQSHLNRTVACCRLQGSAHIALSPLATLPAQCCLLRADGCECHLDPAPAGPPDLTCNPLQAVDFFFSHAPAVHLSQLPDSLAWLSALRPLPFYLPPLYNV